MMGNGKQIVSTGDKGGVKSVCVCGGGGEGGLRVKLAVYSMLYLLNGPEVVK